MSFQKIDPQLFFKTKNPKDPRLGSLCLHHSIDELNSPSFLLAGYPDDEGITLNKGRPGAKEAPHAIRQMLYRMTPKGTTSLELCDLGDLDTSLTLEKRHEAVRAQARKAYELGHCWIGLGGGHDYGFPDAAAFLDVCNTNNDAIVINIDAHLDVRPLHQGLSSGTPFYRLLSEFNNFSFVEVGIQQQCNSSEHVSWCQEQGGDILSFEEVLYSGKTLVEVFQSRFSHLLNKKRPCFLSVDIDGFSSSYAMGCSQSWPAGLEPQSFFPFFQLLLEKLNVRGLGIYEVSPPLDQDHRTSKLAAQIIHHYLFQ